MKKALVYNGKVVQIVERGEEFDTHSDYTWHDCDDNVSTGFTYDKKAKQFNPRPARVKTYKDKRAVEYPEIGDQLDALWKQINDMRFKGTPLVQDADNILGQILAVKAKHPKPKGK